MKESNVSTRCSPFKTLISIIFLVALSATAVFSQAVTEADAMQRRLMRARALAAAHNLGAAAAELDNIRNTATDDSIKEIARIMLMGVYLEGADYTRALALLDETYNARSASSESSVRAYYTLAGQSVRGAREHLDRYRSFGINIADRELPAEAAGDLDRLRLLLERVAEQAKQMCEENARSTEAVALLEDVASVRATLARNRADRQQWQNETAEARQKLAVSETRIGGQTNMQGRPVGAIVTPASTNPPAIASNNTTSNPPPAEANAQMRASQPLTKKTVATTETRPPKPAKQDEPARSNPAPASVADGQPVEVGSLIEKATARVAPSYPQTARTARITGEVKVFLIINENGEVTKIQSSDGPAVLRGAAESAARLWKFKPAHGRRPARSHDRLSEL